jgi:hypothetical protein
MYGGRSDDRFVGGGGNDVINGGTGNDTLSGVDPTATQPGLGEIDFTNGWDNGDRFILGDQSNVYFDDGNPTSDGAADYARVVSFAPSQGAVIQLHGSAGDYRLVSVPGGTQILLDKPGTEPDEIIALIEFSPTGLSLTEPYFSYLALPPGDYNQNGVVDAADYVVWRKTLTNNVVPYSGADGDGDGVVDDDDYGVWRAHFGQTLGAGSGADAHVAESLRDSVASVSERLPYVIGGAAHANQPPTLSGVIGVARPELSAMGVGVTGTRRENHALRPRLRDVPLASRDNALLAWLARRTLDADLREIGDLEIFASDEPSGDSPKSFDNVIDAIFARFVVEL